MVNTLIVKGDDLKPIVLTYLSENNTNEDSISEHDFNNLLDWIIDYLLCIKFDIEFNIKCDVSNRNSLNKLFVTIEKLAFCARKGHNVVVNWYLQNNDLEMKQSIYIIEKIIAIPINVICL